MKIKTKKRDRELPSTVVVKNPTRGKRVYWTGTSWTKDFFAAKTYLREEARTKAKHKGGFAITIGFRS